MGSVKIIKGGAGSSIQDLGRSGLAFFGIPKSGCQDPIAASQANLLVGNNSDDCLIEMSPMAPSFEFQTDAYIAITGSEKNFFINNNPISLYNPIHLKKGDILTSKTSKSSSLNYIAISGNLSAESIYNSRSTYTICKFGGFHGRFLKDGDILFWEEGFKKEIEKTTTNQNIIHKNIAILKGPEFNLLTEASIQILLSSQFKKSPDSNRMGLRLNGPTLSTINNIENSQPVLPGFMQLTPSGKPIIVNVDGQTTGGYARIAYMRYTELANLNRLPLNVEFGFKLI